MKPDSDLRNNLKSIRTSLGMSQQDLANLAGVTRQTISGVESRHCAPAVAMKLRLASALGCHVEDLFWFEQELPEVEAILAKSILLQSKTASQFGADWGAMDSISFSWEKCFSHRNDSG